jgi:hypothetical protein
MGMAVLAALSLAITVLLAQRALDNAADLVGRGDGESLVAKVVVDLWEVPWPLTDSSVATVLAKYQPAGLRYLAVVDRADQHVRPRLAQRRLQLRSPCLAISCGKVAAFGSSR